MRPWTTLLLLMVLGCSAQVVSGGKLAPCPGSPNCVNSASPDNNITPFPGGKEVWARLRDAIVCLGGTIVAEQNGYLHATFSSKVFAFIDDLECSDEGDHIQIRSAARSGWWDFGVNRRRVESLRNMVEGRASCN